MQTQINLPDWVDVSVFGRSGLNYLPAVCPHRSAGSHRRCEGNFYGQQQGLRDVHLIHFVQSRWRQWRFLRDKLLNVSRLFNKDKNMNATCAASSAADDEDEDDEDGEAVDMEGKAQLCVSCLQNNTEASHSLRLRRFTFCVIVLGRVRGERPAGHGRGRPLTWTLSLVTPTTGGVSRGGSHTCSQIACRPPWTPARWWKPKPKWSPGARTPSSRPGRTTCTSPTTNTTRHPDSGCLDTTKYVHRVKNQIN